MRDNVYAHDTEVFENDRRTLQDEAIKRANTI